LKDIAKRVGKSVPTVSRALGGFEDIALETRLEVQRVAREMGYVPSAAARSLQKRRADTITLILPATRTVRFSDPFFSEFLTGLVEQTVQLGFSLSVATDAGEDEADIYLHHLRSGRSDGFVIIRTQRQDRRIDLLREEGAPFVAFGRVEGDNDFYLVDEDGAAAMHQIVDHLVALGHRRLACITEPLHLTKAHHRMEGFLAGLQAHGLSAPPEYIIESNYRQRSGRVAASRLLDLPEPPTAIVAWNDLLALGALGEAQARGLVVGRDVSITGFDDIPLAEYTHPPLTTVHQPAHQLGSQLAHMLIRIINNEPVEPKQVIVQPPLVVRASTGPPAR
ncbi:MAG: LacI family transcriptional regulator, partial [Caldilineae bacterium]